MNARSPRRRPRFTGVPSRRPGEDEVGLEPLAGDIQLKQPKLAQIFGSRRGERKATPAQRARLYHVGDEVPVSGVYDLVDEDGDHLGSQITCHEGSNFPATRSAKAHEYDEPYDSRVRPHYRYRLAYEAEHLVPPPPQPEPPELIDERIHLPGEIVEASGVYNVVDAANGGYLGFQRACVKSKHGPSGRTNVFPESEGAAPGTYGYKLEYPAQSLRDR
jgi:hypothetical protein